MSDARQYRRMAVSSNSRIIVPLMTFKNSARSLDHANVLVMLLNMVVINCINKIAQSVSTKVTLLNLLRTSLCCLRIHIAILPTGEKNKTKKTTKKFSSVE